MSKLDAIAVLKEDHRTVEKLFAKFDETGDRAFKTRADIVAKLIHELSVHAAIEEMVFYPVARELSPEIESQVLESLEEHHVAKWVLSELSDMDPQHERFVAKVTVLKESITHHVEEEESELFPLVRKAASAKVLDEVGEALRDAKKIAPTRPHPRAADTPPGNTANVVLGVVDRLRNQLRAVSR